ncbi:MAG: Nif11-like leader peptide family natural product precursor [Oscillospiraceae bacterium]|nr:Nif11-like leader peptide family natural product precursor [Oscillospiraceae bacterium]
MTNVQKFYEALAKDKTLQEKAQKLNEKYGDEKLPECEVLAESVRFAESEGYSFTIAELEEYMKAKKSEMGGEVDESELEAVAGGFVHQPKDISGGCVCYWAGGGGGRHNNDEIAWGCGCAGYGQGGDAIAWHWICICMAGGVGGFRSR